MFVSNGMVYASAPTEGIKVTSARVVDNLVMIVTFNTGETRLFDASELLGYEAFKPLANRKVFEDFTLSHGTLTWLDDAIDIAPEGLYKRSYPYHEEPVVSAG